MKTMTNAEMEKINGGDCTGLRRVALVAAILGQEEVTLACICTMILEGCPF